MYYFEKFPVGRVFGLGHCTVSEEEIVAFGTCYGPQPFVDGLLSDSASLGSPGIDELRWPTPIHPGDTLRARYTAASSRESRSHPEWGIVQGLAIGANQDGVSAITMSVTNLINRRTSAKGSEALRSGVPGVSM